MYFDDVHHKVDLAFTSMRSAAPALKKLEQAAAAWQKQEQLAHDSFMKYVEAIEDLSSKAMAGTPPAKDIGSSFVKVADVYRQLELAYRLVVNAVNEEILLPLNSRLDADARSLARMERDYDKDCKDHLEELKHCEKELDKITKKSRKQSSEGAVAASLASAQNMLDDRVHAFQQMRVNALNAAVQEERRRYGGVLLGLVRVAKAQFKFHEQAQSSLGRMMDACENFTTTTDSVAVFVQKSTLMRANRPLSSPPEPVSPGPVRRATRVLPEDPFAGLAPGETRARYAFNTSDPAQLAFEVNDVIKLEGDPEENWQFGTNTRSGSTGWFPAHYVHRKDYSDTRSLSEVSTRSVAVSLKAARPSVSAGGPLAQSGPSTGGNPSPSAPPADYDS